MKATDLIALTSILATLIIALVNLFVNRRREKAQQERDDRLRKEQQAREDSIREKERTHIPQIEFNVDCNFYGPQQDNYLVEVLLTVHNKGRVKQEFKDVTLRIRGIKENQTLEYWEGRKPRLLFPENLVDDEPVVPSSVDHFSAEPGERHVFTYVTKIPASIKYILAYASFSYDGDSSHDTERVFPVTLR